MDAVGLAGSASELGLAGLAILILIGGALRWWVYGWAYAAAERRIERLEGEVEAWRQSAFTAAKLAETGADVAAGLAGRPRGAR